MIECPPLKIVSYRILPFVAAMAAAVAPSGGPAGAQQEAEPTAPVSSGLAFALTLLHGGRELVGGRYDLRVPGAKGPLRLTLEQTEVRAGTLAGLARLTNETGATIYGLRLGITGATATPREPGAKPRPLSPRLPPPLEYGDLLSGQESGLAFRVDSLAFDGDTEYAVVLGAVSGVAEAGAFDVPDLLEPAAAELDDAGNLYVADGPGRRVVRTDGQSSSDVAKLPCEPTGLARNPKSGLLFVSCRGGQTVLRVPPRGKKLGAVDIGAEPLALRPDPEGSLHALLPEGRLMRPGGQPKRLDVEGKAQSFDVDRGGSAWVATSAGLFCLDANGKRLRRLPGEGGAVRLGAEGVVCLVEPESPGRPGRVTNYDAEGRLMRRFSPSTLHAPADVAFGRDGRLLIVCRNDGGRTSHMALAFQVF